MDRKYQKDRYGQKYGNSKRQIYCKTDKKELNYSIKIDLDTKWRLEKKDVLVSYKRVAMDPEDQKTDRHEQKYRNRKIQARKQILKQIRKNWRHQNKDRMGQKNRDCKRQEQQQVVGDIDMD